jgi:hypothetical protein
VKTKRVNKKSGTCKHFYIGDEQDMSDSAYSYCENFEKQEKCLFIYLTRTKDS